MPPERVLDHVAVAGTATVERRRSARADEIREFGRWVEREVERVSLSANASERVALRRVRRAARAL